VPILELELINLKTVHVNKKLPMKIKF
jgi:hypothetical protein